MTDDTLDEHSNEMIDNDFDTFMHDTEHTMALGGLKNPFVLIYTASDNGKRGTAYVEMASASNDNTKPMLLSLMGIGAKLAKEKEMPYMVMFGAPGHAERYSIKDADRLDEIAEEIERRMDGGDTVVDTIMCALLMVDGRRRASVSFFESPADGGLVFYKRHMIDDETAFMVGSGVDVFDLCRSVFVGAAEVLGGDKGGK